MRCVLQLRRHALRALLVVVFGWGAIFGFGAVCAARQSCSFIVGSCGQGKSGGAGEGGAGWVEVVVGEGNFGGMELWAETGEKERVGWGDAEGWGRKQALERLIE